MTRAASTLAALLCLILPASAGAAGSAPPSNPLSSYSLSDLDDRPFSLSQFRGRPLVVNFWARWCPPCIAEIPDLISLHGKFKDRGVEVVGIAVEDGTALVRDFVRQQRMDYPVLVAKDKGPSMMQALGNSSLGLPFTVVLDRQGRVVARKLGRMSRQEMEKAFAAALD
jgi:thiol-disulfide isomerase/thioredoxin